MHGTTVESAMDATLDTSRWGKHVSPRICLDEVRNAWIHIRDQGGWCHILHSGRQHSGETLFQPTPDFTLVWELLENLRGGYNVSAIYSTLWKQHWREAITQNLASLSHKFVGTYMGGLRDSAFYSTLAKTLCVETILQRTSCFRSSKRLKNSAGPMTNVPNTQLWMEQTLCWNYPSKIIRFPYGRCGSNCLCGRHLKCLIRHSGNLHCVETVFQLPSKFTKWELFGHLCRAYAVSAIDTPLLKQRCGETTLQLTSHFTLLELLDKLAGLAVKVPNGQFCDTTLWWKTSH